MYVPRHFAETDREALLAHMDAWPFATVVTVRDGAPFASHVPVLVDRRGDGDGAGDVLVGHLARGNSQAEDLAAGGEALVVFQGPHAYVSPRWYASAPNVPTWNYVAVHVYGRTRVVEDRDVLRSLLTKLSARFEPGDGWKPADVAGYVDKLLGGIIGFEVAIERIEGKAKLGQNKSVADRQGAVEGLRAAGEGAVAELMAKTVGEG